MENEIHYCKERGDIIQQPLRFGAKATRLAELALSYRVPAFCAIEASITIALALNDDTAKAMRETISLQAKHLLKATRYAVRSSAILEDGIERSEAGKYSTELDVSPENLSLAIAAVINDAIQKGSCTTESPFAFFIQEYVSPSHAGVLFTRNPLGGREMVVEWGEGNGFRIVGGHKATRTLLLRGQVKGMDECIVFLELFSVGEAIEQSKNTPQDIEWAEKDGTLYVLQARPITTISREAYEANLYLDRMLANESHYYYAREGLSETFSSPTPLARTLLSFLYREDGPIASAYRQFGLRYRHADIFRVFGHALYLDKERELQQFFPSHSYFGDKTLHPHIVRFEGLLTTMINMTKLGRIPLSARDNLYHCIDKHFALVRSLFMETQEFSDVLHIVNEMYADIFRINLLAEKALRSLSAHALRFSVSPLSLLGHSPNANVRPLRHEMIGEIREHFVGNSFDIADLSVFITGGVVEEKQRAQNKFAHPPLVVDKTLLPHVRIAKELVLLREEGRWLSVALGSLLRRALFREGDARGIEHELLFFATCSEVEEDTFDQIILTERQSEFNKWKNFTFPKTVTSIPFLPPFLTYAVSPGHAVGYLRRESDVIAQGDILLVDVLSPELTKYFDRIGGILAREGGILSHLAIVAREYGIPVVVDRRKDIVDALWGKEVSLSGDDGIVVPTR